MEEFNFNQNDQIRPHYYLSKYMKKEREPAMQTTEKVFQLGQ
jgi:hypothetical protein